MELAVTPIKTCLSGVTPIRVPKQMPTSGGLISSRMILRHVANTDDHLDPRIPETSPDSLPFSPPPVSSRYPNVHSAGYHPIKYSAMYPAILYTKHDISRIAHTEIKINLLVPVARAQHLDQEHER